MFNVDFAFPVIQVDTIGGLESVPDMFFMDMNFDGEEEFVIAHDGMKDCEQALSLINYDTLEDEEKIHYDGIKARMMVGDSKVFELRF